MQTPLASIQIGPLVIASVVAGVGALCCLGVWAVVIERVLRAGRTAPSMADRLRVANPAACPPVAVVVPAHNEEGSIGRLVRSLLGQTAPDVRITLALDRCTDGTRAAAEAAIADVDSFHPVEIIEIDACPDGWAGKVHAASAGVQRSGLIDAAELLCFTDADCVFDPNCLAAAVGVMDDPGELRSAGVERIDMLSLLSSLETRGPHELIAQPAAAFELLRQYPLSRVNRADDRQRAFANGQFMLFRRSAYDAIGGHAAVRTELLEDIAFARRVKAQGFRGVTLPAEGSVGCRMYESWAEFRRGWARIFTEAGSRKAGRIAANAWKLQLIGVALPAAAALAIAFGLVAGGGIGLSAAAVGGLGLLAFAIGIGLVCARGGFPFVCVPLFPLGAAHVARILAGAARDLRTGTPTTWGGMSYHRPDRSADEAAGKHDAGAHDRGEGATA